MPRYVPRSFVLAGWASDVSDVEDEEDDEEEQQNEQTEEEEEDEKKKSNTNARKPLSVKERQRREEEAQQKKRQADEKKKQKEEQKKAQEDAKRELTQFKARLKRDIDKMKKMRTELNDEAEKLDKLRRDQELKTRISTETQENYKELTTKIKNLMEEAIKIKNEVTKNLQPYKDQWAKSYFRNLQEAFNAVKTEYETVDTSKLKEKEKQSKKQDKKKDSSSEEENEDESSTAKSEDESSEGENHDDEDAPQDAPQVPDGNTPQVQTTNTDNSAAEQNHLPQYEQMVQDLLGDKLNFTEQEQPYQAPDNVVEGQLAAYYKMNVEFSHYCKRKVYPTIQKAIERESLKRSLHRITYSSVMLLENNGKIALLKNASHQIVRSFLHMHDENIQAVIYAYLLLLDKRITPDRAFDVLREAIKNETTNYLGVSEFYDIALLQLLVEDKNEAGYDGTIQRIVFGLHEGLRNLEWNIILLEWTADWKNMVKMYEYNRGPWHILLNYQKQLEDEGFIGRHLLEVFQKAKENNKILIPRMQFDVLEKDAFVQVLEEIDQIEENIDDNKKLRYEVAVTNKTILTLHDLYIWFLNNIMVADNQGFAVPWFQIDETTRQLKTPKQLNIIDSNRDFNTRIDQTALKWLFNKMRDNWLEFRDVAEEYDRRPPHAWAREGVELAKIVYERVNMEEIIKEIKHWFAWEFEPTKSTSSKNMKFNSILNQEDLKIFSESKSDRHEFWWNLIKGKWAQELDIIVYHNLKRVLKYDSYDAVVKVDPHFISYEQKCVFRDWESFQEKWFLGLTTTYVWAPQNQNMEQVFNRKTQNRPDNVVYENFKKYEKIYRSDRNKISKKMLQTYDNKADAIQNPDQKYYRKNFKSTTNGGQKPFKTEMLELIRKQYRLQTIKREKVEQLIKKLEQVHTRDKFNYSEEARKLVAALQKSMGITITDKEEFLLHECRVLNGDIGTARTTPPEQVEGLSKQQIDELWKNIESQHKQAEQEEREKNEMRLMNSTAFSHDLQPKKKSKVPALNLKNTGSQESDNTLQVDPDANEDEDEHNFGDKRDNEKKPSPRWFNRKGKRNRRLRY